MINIPARFKNIYFWVGLIGTMLNAMRVDPEMLTTWPAVADAALALVTNPYTLACTALAVLGVVVDTSTPGLADHENR